MEDYYNIWGKENKKIDPPKFIKYNKKTEVPTTEELTTAIRCLKWAISDAEKEWNSLFWFEKILYGNRVDFLKKIIYNFDNLR